MMPSQQTRGVRRRHRSAEPAEPEAEIVETGAEVVDLTCESSEPVVVDLTNNDSVEAPFAEGPKGLRTMLLQTADGLLQALSKTGSQTMIVDEDLTSSNSQPSSAEDQPGRTQSDSCILCSDEEDARADGSSSLSITSAADVPQGNRLHPALCNKELRSDKNFVHRRTSSGTISCPICMDGYAEIVQSGRLIVSTKCGHVFCSQCIRDTLKNSHTCPTCRKKLNSRQYHPIYI